MSYVKIVCVCLIFFFITCDSTWSSNEKMTIDTFASTDNRLILLRTSRHITTNIIMLKRRLKKLIQRRKLLYNRLITTKNKMAARKHKHKLRTLQKQIRGLRQKLQKHRKNKNAKLLKSSNNYDIQIKNFQELRKLHEKCKNQGCSQLCSPEVDIIASTSKCHCHRGFYLDPRDNKTCLDINECKMLSASNKCEYKCINTMGSHYCACPHGKKLSFDKRTCMDINECFLNNNHGPCQDGCVNLEGSYRCTCDRFSGTRLNQNGHSCGDINECLEGTSGCSHDCFNVYNSYVCGCPDGMLLDSDEKTCLDINECQRVEVRKTCLGKCINTIGSYFCLEADVNGLYQHEVICEQMTPNPDGYYLCNRNDTVKIVLKGITNREHFLNAPGTICTYHTNYHVPLTSHVCNDRATWEDFPLTIINNTINNSSRK